MNKLTEEDAATLAKVFKHRVEIWVLRLNDMRFSNVEHSENVAWAWSEEELNDLMNREYVGNYDDIVDGKRWGKVFRRGGPLEWYNPPTECFGQVPRRIFPLDGVPAVVELR